MLKTLGVVCIAVACAGGAVWGQPSSGDQKAPALRGHPNDRQPHAKTPTDAQVMAECVVREQADHTGMPKSEAAAACRKRLAPKGTEVTPKPLR